jgi:hypothetical protein
MVANLLISQTASVSHSTTQARPNIFLESFFSFLSTSKNGFLSISLSLSDYSISSSLDLKSSYLGYYDGIFSSSLIPDFHCFHALTMFIPE